MTLRLVLVLMVHASLPRHCVHLEKPFLNFVSLESLNFWRFDNLIEVSNSSATILNVLSKDLLPGTELEPLLACKSLYLLDKCKIQVKMFLLSQAVPIYFFTRIWLRKPTAKMLMEYVDKHITIRVYSNRVSLLYCCRSQDFLLPSAPRKNVELKINILIFILIYLH